MLTGPSQIPSVVAEIDRYHRRGTSVVAVVSAIGNQTDSLLAEAKRYGSAPAPEEAVAELLGTGERQSAAYLTLALYRAGLAVSLIGLDALNLVANGDRLDANPVSVEANILRQRLTHSPVVVVPGFVTRPR